MDSGASGGRRRDCRGRCGIRGRSGRLCGGSGGEGAWSWWSEENLVVRRLHVAGICEIAVDQEVLSLVSCALVSSIEIGLSLGSYYLALGMFGSLTIINVLLLQPRSH